MHIKTECNGRNCTGGIGVQSLGQIDGVDTVLFTIEGEPLEDQNGQEIGYMQPSEFCTEYGIQSACLSE